MTDETPDDDKVTMANTKKEMLQAYNRLLKQLDERHRSEMKPAEKVAEKKKTEARAVADALCTESISTQIGVLKSDIGKTLNAAADRLESEISKYAQVKKAVEAAEAQLAEIYEIEKAASTFAALLEAQRQERDTFEAEMAATRETFGAEIQLQRDEWKKEKTQYEAAIKERDAADQKRRKRDEEEYKYQFERQKQLTLEQYEHDKAKLDREIHSTREEMERDLSERENAVAAAESELAQLRDKVESYPGELEKAVTDAVTETTDRLQRESQAKLDLLQKEYIGERNVLSSRIEALQATVDRQVEQIARLSEQLEHSYRQVQDIAVKAIEGPAAPRSVPHQQSPSASEPSSRE